MSELVDVRAVERLLEKAGYWYPPDAILAVAEGREEYRPLDPAVGPYRLDREAKREISRCLRELEPKLALPPFLIDPIDALNAGN